MIRIGTFINPALPIGAALFLCSVFVAATIGNIGPCGPTSDWGWTSFAGMIVGFVTSCIGAVLSAVKTVKYLWLHMSHKHGNKS